MLIFGHGGLTILTISSLERLQGRPHPWQQPGKLLGIFLFSLLPDIIDKPLALWCWPNPPSTRLLAHSLLFWAVLWGPLLCYKRQLLPYSMAHLLHLPLDGMWRMPRTLLWPFLGLHMDPSPFEEVSLRGLLRWVVGHYSSSGYLVVMEFLGMLICLYALLRYIATLRQRRSPFPPKDLELKDPTEPQRQLFESAVERAQRALQK